MLDVVLRGLVGMVRRMHAVAVRQMGMMRGFFVVTAFIVLGGLAMMLGGVLVMLGSGVMMILMRLGHRILLSRMIWTGTLMKFSDTVVTVDVAAERIRVRRCRRRFTLAYYASARLSPVSTGES
jgi:hypothetical protein